MTINTFKLLILEHACWSGQYFCRQHNYDITECVNYCPNPQWLFWMHRLTFNRFSTFYNIFTEEESKYPTGAFNDGYYVDHLEYKERLLKYLLTI